MHTPSEDGLSPWRAFEIGAFIVVVVLFSLVGPVAGMRALGVVSIAGATKQIVDGRIGFGIEGQAPAGYIRGGWALVLSLLAILLGLAILLRPRVFLVALGWTGV